MVETVTQRKLAQVQLPQQHCARVLQARYHRGVLIGNEVPKNG